jgi:alpha-D-xyloside xylohydrolase
MLEGLLDLDAVSARGEVLWVAGVPELLAVDDEAIRLRVPFRPLKTPTREYVIDEEAPVRRFELRVQALGANILRLTLVPEGDNGGAACLRQSEMLTPETMPKPLALNTDPRGNRWDVYDTNGALRLRVERTPQPIKHWSDLLPPPYPAPEITFFPDGKTKVPFAAHDHFFRKQHDAIALGVVFEGERVKRVVFGFEAEGGESFSGTGERFAKLDLSGRTLELENLDGLGVNNRRTYKNVPFVLSSRPYGLFVHTSTSLRLSLADLSTRALQGCVQDGALDLFLIGGGSVPRVLQEYQSITGKPPLLPRFSYGIWMSRMTYFSDKEVSEIAERLRREDFPCDVLHLDTGWFAKDWVCEWEFSEERFPDPEGFFRRLREQGFYVTLWQTPNIGEGNRLLEEAKAERYLAPLKASMDASGSDFSAQEVAGQIDFTNPRAVAWYQGMLERLLKLGAAAIKTDFGETMDMNADYAGLSAEQLRNIYPLLYQRAAFQITEKVKGQGLIWARAGWAGCQRYPVHWGGDCACSWEGLKGSLRGGLHLGLSGFAYWSHDVPGFHGVPDFMNSWPSDTLYVRWTQVGVFTSHFRYHGTSPREPYEYPEVADTVRRWWKLRYALIPYIEEQARLSVEQGKPILRALALEHEKDPTCWHLDDQYYFGDAFLVAPILNDEGVRDVYLPEGTFVDFWTGEQHTGSRWLKQVSAPLERMPIFVRLGSSVPVYEEPVACTDQMRDDKQTFLVFDESYAGLSSTVLGRLTGL